MAGLPLAPPDRGTSCQHGQPASVVKAACVCRGRAAAGGGPWHGQVPGQPRAAGAGGRHGRQGPGGCAPAGARSWLQIRPPWTLGSHAVALLAALGRAAVPGQRPSTRPCDPPCTNASPPPLTPVHLQSVQTLPFSACTPGRHLQRSGAVRRRCRTTKRLAVVPQILNPQAPTHPRARRWRSRSSSWPSCSRAAARGRPLPCPARCRRWPTCCAHACSASGAHGPLPRDQPSWVPHFASAAHWERKRPWLLSPG